jgi:hypothetical protein
MIILSEIPLFKYIQTYNRLPNVNFGDKERKHKKKYPFLYSMLSNQYSKQVIASKNYYISSNTLSQIQTYLDRFQDKVEILNIFKNTTLFSLTITGYLSESLTTYIFIVTPFNNSLVLDILIYEKLDLSSWISGVFYDSNNMHITVSYNSNENDIVHHLNLFQYFLMLKTLKSFDRIFSSGNENVLSREQTPNTFIDLTHIDLSYIREYLVPITNRREHYRWQFCGPGRTILRQVKVQASIVKSHLRKGKRLS